MRCSCSLREVDPRPVRYCSQRTFLLSTHSTLRIGSGQKKSPVTPVRSGLYHLVTTPGLPEVFLFAPRSGSLPCSLLLTQDFSSVHSLDTPYWFGPKEKPCNASAFRALSSSDHARIQTWNLLSRNQMRYSIAPRGHAFLECGCKYSIQKPLTDTR
jgi:hypothetical protein